MNPARATSASPAVAVSAPRDRYDRIIILPSRDTLLARDFPRAFSCPQPESASSRPCWNSGLAPHCRATRCEEQVRFSPGRIGHGGATHQTGNLCSKLNCASLPRPQGAWFKSWVCRVTVRTFPMPRRQVFPLPPGACCSQAAGDRRKTCPDPGSGPKHCAIVP